jgi:hypothetical protein
MNIENDFTRRRRAQENLKSAIPGVPNAVFRAALHKPRRKDRLYRIDPVGRSLWRCEVWMDAEIHRSREVITRTHMVEHRKQYEREIADLILDGWMLDG